MMIGLDFIWSSPLVETGDALIYEHIEQVPDVEVTLEKVLDGYPLIYHLAGMLPSG